MTDGLTTLRLRYRKADVFLTRGSYLIGRSASCQIVLDHPRVSRKHARLIVDQGRIAVEDLGSVNGIFVNGDRVTGTQELQSGDSLMIGGETLELFVEAAPMDDSGLDSTTRTGLESIPPAPPSTQWDAVTGGVGTQKAEVFELVGKIADRSFAEGRPDEAENVLRAHLMKVLDQSKRGTPMAEATRQGALHYAMELAQATKNKRWLEYVLEFLLAQKIVIGEALARELMTAMQRVGGVDATRIDAYVAMLKSLPDDVEKSRALARVDGLRRAAKR